MRDSFLDEDDDEFVGAAPAGAPVALKAVPVGQRPQLQLAEPLQTPAALVPGELGAEVDVVLANQEVRQEAQRLSGIQVRRDSVFDLESVMEDLYVRAKNLLSQVDGKDEVQTMALGELRQIAKLSMDVMKNAAYINGIKKKHEGEIQLIIQAIAAVDPKKSREIQLAIADLRQKQRDFGG